MPSWNLRRDSSSNEEELSSYASPPSTPEVPTITADFVIDNLSDNIEDFEEKFRAKIKDAKFNKTTPMDDIDPDGWFAEKAFQEFGTEFLGETYADGGKQAVREAIVEDLVEDVQSAVSVGDGHRRFNSLTEDWPTGCRAVLAKEWHDTYGDEVDNNFATEIEGYVERNYEEAESEPVAEEFSEDPTEDLTSSNARRVLFLRLIDESEEMYRDIGVFANFMEHYKNIGDVETAINVQQYDSAIPEEALAELDDPDDWPDHMDPGFVERVECAFCNGDHHVVSANGGEQKYVSNGGEVVDGVDLTTDEYVVQRDGEMLCGLCEGEWSVQSTLLAAQSRETGEYVKLEGVDDIFKVIDGEYPTFDDEVDTAIQSLVNSHGVGDHFHMIVPRNPDAGSAVDSLRDDLPEVTDGTVISGTRIGSHGNAIAIPAVEAQTVGDVKQYLDEQLDSPREMMTTQ